MGLLDRLFSGNRRAQRLLRDGIEQARGRQPDRAIESYSAVLEMVGIPESIRASALFNRGATYASLKRLSEARADLEAVAAMGNAPAKIRSEARSKLSRMDRRSR